jgi:hypothetical protein
MNKEVEVQEPKPKRQTTLLFCASCGTEYFSDMGRCPVCDSHRGITGWLAEALREEEYGHRW